MYSRRRFLLKDFNQNLKFHNSKTCLNVDLFEALKSQKCHVLEEAYAFDREVINMTDEMGNTLYHAAARLGRSDAIQWLHGKNNSIIHVDDENSIGYTAIHLACEKGFLHCVIALKMQGANLHVRTFPDEMSVLHLAARGGHWPIINLLIKAHCSPTVKDRNGITPLDHAVQQGHDKAVEVLADYLHISKPEVAVIPPELRRLPIKALEAEELRLKREMFIDFHETKHRTAKTFLDVVRDANELGEDVCDVCDEEKEDRII